MMSVDLQTRDYYVELESHLFDFIDYQSEFQ